jgi:ATP-binding cassette subfamily G (WHITE) protein 2 (SNQ2)
LRKLADQGQAILCTIHQPSSLLFESFDRLLLLKKGGKTVYFGDIGEDSEIVREYFARHGAVCPPSVNPAEYMLEAIGAGVSPRIGSRDWNDIWLESSECKRSREEINEIKAAALSRPQPETKAVSTCASSRVRLHRRKYQFIGPLTDATPFFYQLRTVVQRNSLALRRSPDYIFTRIFLCGFISLFVSLAFLQLGTSVRALQFRVFGM